MWPGTLQEGDLCLPGQSSDDTDDVVAECSYYEERASFTSRLDLHRVEIVYLGLTGATGSIELAYGVSPGSTWDYTFTAYNGCPSVETLTSAMAPLDYEKGGSPTNGTTPQSYASAR